MHMSNRLGCKIAYSKEFMNEGENLFLKSTAGYARNRLWIGGSLNFKINPVNEQAKFPPAESPARIIFLGLTL